MQKVSEAQTESLARRLKVDPTFVAAFLEEVRRREPTATLKILKRTTNSGPYIVVYIEYGDMLQLEQCCGYTMVSSFTGDFPGVQYSSLIIEESITDESAVQAVQQRWCDIRRVTLAELPSVFAEYNARLYERVERLRQKAAAKSASAPPARCWWQRRSI